MASMSGYQRPLADVACGWLERLTAAIRAACHRADGTRSGRRVASDGLSCRRLPGSCGPLSPEPAVGGSRARVVKLSAP